MAASTSFKQQCPSCEAMVTIKDASLAGKKVDCPKCKFRFVVEAPADEEEGAKPAKKGAAAGNGAAKKPAAAKTNGEAKPKGKPLPRRPDDEDDEGKPKKKKKGGPNTTLLIGGGLGFLAIAILGIAWATGLFGGDETPSNSGSGQQQAGGPGAPGAPGKPGAPGDKKDPEPGDGAKKDPTPGAVVKDVTNLLPNDTEAVLALDAEKFLYTPVGGTLLDSGTGSTEFFKSKMGFDAESVTRVILGINETDGWLFGIVRTKSPIKFADLKSAMTLGNKKTIKKRDYYPIQSNDLFRMVADYLEAERSQLKLPAMAGKKNRSLALTQLDDQTLVIADVGVLEKFLQEDAQPKFLSELTSPGAGPGGNTGPGMPGMPGGPQMPGGMGPGGPPPMPGVGPPMPGGMSNPPMPGGMSNPPRPGGMSNPPMPGGMSNPPMPGGMSNPPMPGGMSNPPMPGGPGGMGPGYPGAPGGNAGGKKPLYTSNPTYRTIAPELKALINQLEENQKPVLTLVAKRSKGDVEAAKQLKQLLPSGQEIRMLNALGISVQNFSSARFTLTALLDYEKDEDAKAVDKTLRTALPLLAKGMSASLGIPVQSNTGQEQNNPFNPFPGFPGGPMFPPMGPGGMSNPPGGMSNPPNNTPPMPGYPPMGGMSNPPGGMSNPPGGMSNPPNNTPPMPGYPPMGPGGMPPFGPGGFPNPNDPNRQPKQDTSTLAVSTSAAQVTLTVDLRWQPVYASKVSPVLRNYVDHQKGRAMMHSGKTPWHDLPRAIKQMQSAGSAVRAAHARPADASRFGMSYPPDQRVSWMPELLPHLGYDFLNRNINRDLSWDAEQNLKAGTAWVPEFLNPSYPDSAWRARLPSLRGRELGATNFVGLSGIGLDAAEYPDDPQHAKKLGVFGYERETSFQAIKDGDGLENTIYMIQVPPNVPRPWIRGGGSTVQGVPETNSFAPFAVKQPDGQTGAYVLMADGSVRFIKKGISDQAFKALATYKGGDPVGDLDAVAPKVDLKTKFELKTPAPGQGPLPGNPPKSPDEVKPPVVENPKPQDMWQDVQMPKAKIAFQMPGKPSVSEGSAEYPARNFTDADYEVAVGKPLNDKDAKKSVQKIIDTGTGNKVEYNGRFGARFETSLNRGKDVVPFIHYSTFTKDNLEVSMRVRKDRVSPADAERFFKSLRELGN